ncbi:hypothetical protein HMI56_000755 [Coelomomyces lativittatus]|nr:hypothetical protein HMI56_000755 [Coelomomyces lativittatus]
MTTNASSRVTSNFPPITSSSSSASSSNALRCNTNHLQFKNHYNVTTPLPPTPGPSLHSLPHTTTSLLHPHYKSDTATTAESTMQLASPTTSECSISSTHSNEKKEENEFLSSFAVNSIQENEMNVDVEMSKNSFNVMDTSLKTMSMSTTQLSLTSSDLIDSKLDVRALSSFTTYQSSDAQNNQEKMVMKEENDLMMTMEDEDDMVIHLDFMDGTPSLPTPSISSLPSSSHITSATTTTNTSKFNTLHGIHAILSNDPEEEAMRMNEDDIDVLPPPPLLTNPMKFIEKLSGSSSCFYDPVHHDRDPSSTSSTHHLPPSYDPTSSFLESPPSNFTTTPSSTSMAFHSPPTGNCVDDSEVLLIAAHALNGLKEGFQQGNYFFFFFCSKEKIGGT